MNIPGTDRPFIVVGENIHTTRVLSRKGKLVAADTDGNPIVRFRDGEGKRRVLSIPEAHTQTQDYDEGRVKHLKIAIQDAMAGGTDGMDYLQRQIQRQQEAGSDFLDLNVDEISLRPNEQFEAMRWLVNTVGEMGTTPLSIDSSNIETIQAGLETARTRDADGPLMLNSASLERLDALDLAVTYKAQVVITAAGESGMPQNADERLDHARRMTEAADAKGIAPADIYIDPLVFPISVDSQYGNHSFDAIRRLRQDLGDAIHITGGFSNVSFGLPCRRLINDVFLLLAVEAGADSAIMDPTATSLDEVFALDRLSRPYQLAEDMLLGRDEYCAKFLRAYRKGELA
jgi:5-methyltetrahydrofolate corrinoid/iron sulfur protein methyltransferase